jgi:hypothetical protein
MNLVEMRAALKIEFADTAWDDDEIDRAVTEAVADLSRFLPDEKIKEFTFILTASSESWTSSGAHGTYASLANKPIKWDSETITTDPAGTTYTRDTDYTMDYSNGEITTISGGDMAISTGYLASYTNYREGIDISSITDLIRVRRVEYPISSEATIKWVPFYIHSDVLYISGEDRQISDKRHLAVYYDAACTPPTAGADGSYPSFLDEVVLKGASAYALMTKSLSLSHDANTTLGEVAAIWTDEETYRDAAHAYLTSGDNYINTVNVGGNVAELYGTYAQVDATIARLSENVRNAKMSHANAQISLADRYMKEALERRNEFWSILRDKGQYRSETALVAQRQSP